jgi:hypoxanthine-guanine phosphoribosyltransferase
MDERIQEQISAAKLAQRIAELGQQIGRDYAGKELVLVGVLKGSWIFMADLARAIHGVDVRVEFLGVQSYGDSASPSPTCSSSATGSTTRSAIAICRSSAS